MLYFTWWVGSSLEQHWGSFKFNVYYLVGALATIVAAVLVGPQSNTWLDWSLFLAFATIFPEVEILLMFILPIRVKWLGMLSGGWIVYNLAIGGPTTRAAIIAAMANYVLFFAAHWWAFAKDRKVVAEQRVRRRQFESASASDAPVFGQRECAICGAKEADGADIRVCSCEKCGGTPRALCLAHARNH
jgi:membrane associated rhomboid family serine protease